MNTFALIALVCVAAVALYFVFKQGPEPPAPASKLRIVQVEDPDAFVETGVLDRDDRVNNIFIAGLKHHCTKRDVGYFGGMVFNEKDNAYDRKAMAIGSRQAGKIIGYVPAAILDSYRDWCSGKDAHCVGYVYMDDETGALRGRAKVYHPDLDQDTILDDVEKYLQVVCERFGWEMPKEFEM